MSYPDKSVACLLTLLLAASALGQSTGVNTTVTTAPSNTSTVALGNPASAAGQLDINQQLRGELILLFVDVIHNLFSQIKMFLGLSAATTDPTSDPLTLLESLITDLVNNSLNQ